MAKAKKVPINDIWLAAFLDSQGLRPEITKQGTRVVFEFPATDDFYRLARAYNENPQVPLLNYITAVRQLRAQMISAKGRGNE